MGSITDYLDWRGDLSLAADPFNEVDSLILSELIYSEFDGIVPGPGTGEFPMFRDVAAQYFEQHTEEELSQRRGIMGRAPLYLLKRTAESERFGTMRIGNYLNHFREDVQAQMAAVTFLLSDGTVYAAFRGTDSTLVGWKEDFNMGYMSQTEGQKMAVRWLNDCLLNTHMPIRIGGHSKGGNFAVYAGCFCEDQVKERIVTIYNFDGPGFLSEITQTEEFQQISGRISSIVPKGSLFGLLLSNPIVHTVVESTQSGIMQHDGLSWKVVKNRFVRAEGISDTSSFWENTLRDWIGSLSKEERRDFIDTVYEIVTTTGAEKLADLQEDLLHSYTEIIKAAGALPKERQNLIISTLKALVKAGTAQLFGDFAKPQQLLDAWKKKLLPEPQTGEEALPEPQSQEALPEPQSQEALPEPQVQETVSEEDQTTPAGEDAQGAADTAAGGETQEES